MKRLILLAALAGLGVATAEPQRKLVLLKTQGFSSWAETDPAFDYTCYLPRRYQIRGLDSRLIQATASTNGLPARLLGSYAGDQVQVSAGLEPALLPLDLNVSQPWRGVVALGQSSTRLAIVPEVWQACQSRVAAPDGLYQVTAWTRQGQLHIEDLKPLGSPQPPVPCQGPLQAVVSEGFVQKTLDLYRTSHPAMFRFQEPGGRAGFELSRLGLTSVTGSLRAYASLHGHIDGLGKLVEGEWESSLQVQLQKGYARLSLQPQGQSLRLVRPFFAEMPQSWADAIHQLTRRFFNAQLALPIPGAYLEPLLTSGLVTPTELEGLQLHPASWGDRRSGCLVLTSAPAAAGPPVQLGWAAPEGFALGLSGPALNRGFAQTLPRLLPLRIDLPSDRLPAPRVLIFRLDLKQLEIRQLQLSYQRSAFRFDPCEIAIAWELGPLSGVEPGARLTGWAVPSLENGQMLLAFHIEQMEFLSPHILDQSPEDQQRLREEILNGLQRVPLPLPLPLSLATPVHPRSRLILTGLRPTDEALWFIGQWRDP